MEVQKKTILQDYCLHILRLFGVLSLTDEQTPFRKYNWRVLATALNFFRRYFHRSSCIPGMDSITIIMLASLFLAGKLEGSFIRAQELVNIIGGAYSDKDINEAEKNLIEGLSFDIHVEHPQSIIVSLLGHSWEQFIRHKDIAPSELLHTWKRAIVERSCYVTFLLQATELVITNNSLALSLNIVAIAIASIDDEKLSSISAHFDLYLRDKIGLTNIERARQEVSPLILPILRQLTLAADT